MYHQGPATAGYLGLPCDKPPAAFLACSRSSNTWHPQESDALYLEEPPTKRMRYFPTSHETTRSCTATSETQSPAIYSTGASTVQSTTSSPSGAQSQVLIKLNNRDLWAKFVQHTTEMIITKHGRRMFPCLSFHLSGLDVNKQYEVFVDVVLADDNTWKYHSGTWQVCGNAARLPEVGRLYLHPDSPNTGQFWMSQEISFGKVKLTNNKANTDSPTSPYLVLNSMHKYQPRVHVLEVEPTSSEGGRTLRTHSFTETQFIAVTAYQNTEITQLKIDYNPFAKGFREGDGRRIYEQFIPRAASLTSSTPPQTPTTPVTPQMFSELFTQPATTAERISPHRFTEQPTPIDPSQTFMEHHDQHSAQSHHIQTLHNVDDSMYHSLPQAANTFYTGATSAPHILTDSNPPTNLWQYSTSNQEYLFHQHHQQSSTICYTSPPPYNGTSTISSSQQYHTLQPSHHPQLNTDFYKP